jgi:Fur family ferric uptake transcriptional regulator/Fur family peroxide stress response transcriptional regulator
VRAAGTLAGRDTAQRRAVLEVLRRSFDHPTAAEIHARVLGVLPGVGAATVYRTLRLLVDGAAVQELRLRDETVIRYDANTHLHDHVVCEICGVVVDVHAQVPDTVTTAVARHTGFDITGYDLRFRGRCPSCISNHGPHPA